MYVCIHATFSLDYRTCALLIQAVPYYIKDMATVQHTLSGLSSIIILHIYLCSTLLLLLSADPVHATLQYKASGLG